MNSEQRAILNDRLANVSRYSDALEIESQIAHDQAVSLESLVLAKPLTKPDLGRIIGAYNRAVEAKQLGTADDILAGLEAALAPDRRPGNEL